MGGKGLIFGGHNPIVMVVPITGTVIFTHNGLGKEIGLIMIGTRLSSSVSSISIFSRSC